MRLKITDLIPAVMACVFTLTVGAAAQASREGLETKMSEKIELLNDYSASFASVNLEFSNSEKAAINNLIITKTDEYNRFGKIELLKSELPKFLHKVTRSDSNSIETLTQMIYEVANTVCKASKKSTGWIAVRAFLPTDRYDISRWHFDGSYYSPRTSFQFKFAAALKGSQTLFFSLNPRFRESFAATQNEKRSYWNEMLDKKEIITSAPEEGTFFIVGDMEHAAVHSEPPISEPRLFFSVVPANENELEEILSRMAPQVN